MASKDENRLRVGVLGCGPIAQAAHFESAIKAQNAELYAICDVAPDLLERMAATYAPQKTFADYDAMLADPEVLTRSSSQRPTPSMYPRPRAGARGRQARAVRKAARRRGRGGRGPAAGRQATPAESFRSAT